MNTIALWPTILETIEALGERYEPAMNQAAVEAGVSEWRGWLLAALMFDPEPISAARLRVRNPYTSARRFEERLEKAAEQGFLAPLGRASGEFLLTAQGRRAADCTLDAAYTALATLQPLPPADLESLADILHRLVMASLDAPQPPGKWLLHLSRHLDPGDDAPAVTRIDQYGGDLAAYRDASHLAAWQSHNIEGNAWEVFTYIWRGEAATLDALCQALDRRGYTSDEYRQALEDLNHRGWISETASAYQATVPGEDLRQATEEVTDHYFYAPWSCLSIGETEDLRSLTSRFRDALLAQRV